MGEVLKEEADTRSGFRGKSLLGKYKPVFKTDIISSVEKSYFIHDYCICGWPHGLKYLDVGTISHHSGISFSKVLIAGDVWLDSEYNFPELKAID